MGREKKGNRREKIFKNTVLFLFVVFIIFNALKVPFLNSVSLSISKNFFLGRDVVLKPFNNLIENFNSKRVLIEENKDLKKQLKNLELKLLSSEISTEEYKRYSELIEDGNEKKILKVLLKPPVSSFDNLVVTGEIEDSDIGKRIYFKNVILGELVEKNDDMGIVKLYSTPENILNAKLTSGEQIEIIGKGSGRYEAVLSKDIEINEGDPVIFPDQEIVVLGVVNKVIQSEDDLFNNILFNIPIDFREIDFVEIKG